MSSSTTEPSGTNIILRECVYFSQLARCNDGRDSRERMSSCIAVGMSTGSRGFFLVFFSSHLLPLFSFRGCHGRHTVPSRPPPPPPRKNACSTFVRAEGSAFPLRRVDFDQPLLHQQQPVADGVQHRQPNNKQGKYKQGRQADMFEGHKKFGSRYTEVNVERIFHRKEETQPG